MLEIDITLNGTNETVHIDWCGPRPYTPALMEFLQNQYPGARIDIYDPEAVPVFDDDHRYEVHLRGVSFGTGSFESCLDYCRVLMERGASEAELSILNRENGEVYDASPILYAIPA